MKQVIAVFSAALVVAAIVSADSGSESLDVHQVRGLPTELDGDIEISTSDDKLITMVSADIEPKDKHVDFYVILENVPGTEPAKALGPVDGHLSRTSTSLEVRFGKNRSSVWRFGPRSETTAAPTVTLFAVDVVRPYRVRIADQTHKEIASQMFAFIAQRRKPLHD